MISEKEIKILAYLRKNGRHSVTQIAHKLGIPRTTVFEKIKKFKRLGLIKKFTCVIDFGELGNSIQATILFKAPKCNGDLSNTLKKSIYTNTVSKLGNEYDIMASVIFPNMNEIREFLDHITKKYEIKSYRIFYVAREIKREGFMTNSQPVMCPISPLNAQKDTPNYKRKVPNFKLNI
jgi:Lrp/AsnC family transcriptional regulator, leucine-responsive regulatory protein